MTDKNYIKNVKKNLALIYSNLNHIDKADLEVLLWGIMYGIDEHLSIDKIGQKYKSNIEKEMIEERIYNHKCSAKPIKEDALERAFVNSLNSLIENKEEILICPQF